MLLRVPHSGSIHMVFGPLCLLLEQLYQSSAVVHIYIAKETVVLEAWEFISCLISTHIHRLMFNYLKIITVQLRHTYSRILET